MPRVRCPRSGPSRSAIEYVHRVGRMVGNEMMWASLEALPAHINSAKCRHVSKPPRESFVANVTELPHVHAGCCMPRTRAAASTTIWNASNNSHATSRAKPSAGRLAGRGWWFANPNSATVSLDGFAMSKWLFVVSLVRISPVLAGALESGTRNWSNTLRRISRSAGQPNRLHSKALVVNRMPHAL